eukprot:1161045-Pelagomonas_calceolata.AAC.27
MAVKNPSTSSFESTRKALSPSERTTPTSISLALNSSDKTPCRSAHQEGGAINVLPNCGQLGKF